MKFRLLRQDMPVDASATVDSVGRSFRLDLRLYRYRPYIEPMQWQQRMDDSHQMVDIVGCTSSSHDATRTGRQTIYQTGRESNHKNAYAGSYYDW